MKPQYKSPPPLPPKNIFPSFIKMYVTLNLNNLYTKMYVD